MTSRSSLTLRSLLSVAAAETTMSVRHALRSLLRAPAPRRYVSFVFPIQPLLTPFIIFIGNDRRLFQRRRPYGCRSGYVVPLSFVSHLLTIVSDVPVAGSSGKTVCLPYHLVPGMDTNTQLFLKAQATLAKQAPATAVPAAAATEHASAAHVNRLFSLNQGIFISPF